MAVDNLLYGKALVDLLRDKTREITGKEASYPAIAACILAQTQQSIARATLANIAVNEAVISNKHRQLFAKFLGIDADLIEYAFAPRKATSHLSPIEKKHRSKMKIDSSLACNFLSKPIFKTEGVYHE